MARNRHPGALAAAVLDLARRRGTVTRLELAKELSVTPATITNVVKRLLAEGLLDEVGHRESTGGKRASILRVNALSRFAVGVSVGFTSMTAVLTDFEGAMVGQTALPLDATTAPDAHDAGTRLERFLGAMGVAKSDVVGVGLASGSVGNGRNPSSSAFAKQLGETLALPVVSHAEATCAAVGEYWTGEARDDTRFATVFMADTLTAGFLDGSRPLSLTARGSIGHMSVDHGGPLCPCGSRGCLNLVASPTALVASACARPKLRRELGLEGSDAALRRDFALLCRAAVAGQADAVSLIREAAEAIGWAILDMSALLALDDVFLAGPGFTYAGALYEGVIREVTGRVSGPGGCVPLQVRLSRLDQEAAALGAASLATQAMMPQVAAPVLD